MFATCHRSAREGWLAQPSAFALRASARVNRLACPAIARVASEGWSGRRGSNPRPTAWKAVTLPLSYSRLRDASHFAAAPFRRGRPAPYRPSLRQPPPRVSAAAKQTQEGRVRTSVARRRQVYSLLRLTALPPPRYHLFLLKDRVLAGAAPRVVSAFVVVCVLESVRPAFLKTLFD